jgi:hypothetical protein
LIDYYLLLIYHQQELWGVLEWLGIWWSRFWILF